MRKVYVSLSNVIPFQGITFKIIQRLWEAICRDSLVAQGGQTNAEVLAASRGLVGHAKARAENGCQIVTYCYCFRIQEG